MKQSSLNLRRLNPAVLGFVSAAIILFSGCAKGAGVESLPDTSNNATVTGKAATGKQLYQCSMHPNIISNKPGICPICGMDLQPVSQINVKGIPGRGAVELSPLQAQLINIRVTPVTRGQAKRTIRAVGVFGYDQTKIAEVNSRVMGWVEKLYVDKPGAYVERNQPLLALYSPDLYAAEKEYLLAYKDAHKTGKTTSGRLTDEPDQLSERNRVDAESRLKAARKRLEFWDISDAQISALTEAGDASKTMDLTAPQRGFAVEKNVLPLQMIRPGDVLYRIADLSTIWMDVDVYEYELPYVRVGQAVHVTVDAYPAKSFAGKVDFIYPYLQSKTRTAKVRLVFENDEYLLKPDMYGDAVIEIDLGNQLLVPRSAVFDTGRRQYLFVQEGAGMFIPKEVQLGPATGDDVVVMKGVNAGDEVVIEGNFLLDSESQLRAATMEPALSNTFSGSMSPPGNATVIPASAKAKRVIVALMNAYQLIYDALTQDRSTGIDGAVAQLKTQLHLLDDPATAPAGAVEDFETRVKNVEKCAEAFAPGESLDDVRSHFGEMSSALVDLFRRYPPPVATPVAVFECPMWKKSRALWMQTGATIRNPFIGQSMPTCGERKGTIGGVHE